MSIVTEYAALRICEHIESFPRVASHYISKTSTRQFLGPELKLSRMYDLYQEKCKLDCEESPSNFIYRKHTGKCIRRFGGIYAYCRYFIDRKW